MSLLTHQREAGLTGPCMVAGRGSHAIFDASRRAARQVSLFSSRAQDPQPLVPRWLQDGTYKPTPDASWPGYVLRELTYLLSLPARYRAPDLKR